MEEKGDAVCGAATCPSGAEAAGAANGLLAAGFAGCAKGLEGATPNAGAGCCVAGANGELVVAAGCPNGFAAALTGCPNAFVAG